MTEKKLFVFYASRIVIVPERTRSGYRSTLYSNVNADEVGPASYASFVISPGSPEKPAKILAEEQDKFEFPDKKISVRIKG